MQQFLQLYWVSLCIICPTEKKQIQKPTIFEELKNYKISINEIKDLQYISANPYLTMI